MAITVPSKAAVASGSSFGHFTVDGAKQTNKAVCDESSNETNIASLKTQVCLFSNDKFVASTQLAA